MSLRGATPLPRPSWRGNVIASPLVSRQAVGLRVPRGLRCRGFSRLVRPPLHHRGRAARFAHTPACALLCPLSPSSHACMRLALPSLTVVGDDARVVGRVPRAWPAGDSAVAGPEAGRRVSCGQLTISLLMKQAHTFAREREGDRRERRERGRGRGCHARGVSRPTASRRRMAARRP